jgi:hypothetical protein
MSINGFSPAGLIACASLFALYARSKSRKPVCQMLVPALNLIDISYNAVSFRAHGGDEHCHSRTDIGAYQF